MIPTNIPSDAPLFLLPTPPAGASADLVAKFDQISALFIGDDGDGDDAMGEGWLEAKKAIADHPCRTGADLAVKLMTIIHEVAPVRKDGKLFVDVSDFPTTLTLNLLLSAINDALAIGGCEALSTDITFTEARRTYRAAKAAWDAFLQTPAPDHAAVLEKMGMIEARYLVDHESVPDVDWQALRADIARLSGAVRPKSAGDDREILDTWAEFTNQQWTKLDGDHGTVSEQPIIHAPATTIAGVIAKLRLTMFMNRAESWIEAQALGATVPNFETRLNGEDAITETLWSAIKSLEAMEAGR